MSDDPTPWDNATEIATAVPGEVSPQDGYVLLLALLSVFIGGTLVLLSGILIICRRCCEADRRHSRASDDPEKTNTTYLDDSQPAQDITIKVEDPDCLSSSSYRDAESERFLSSSSSTARRVSFNEAALFDQGKKTQEKGRRYTLTEGDFHHLKNARLTHLHLPPPALKIVTIHECESSENNLAMTPRLPPTKPGLAIFQPPVGALPQPALPSHAVCPSSALPGDTYNSTVDTSFTEASPSPSSDSGEGPSFAAAPRKAAAAGGAGPGEPPAAPSQGTVLQFFTRLRRHASLDGASPYFRIKRWKLESTQRASSLDTRGSPKRRQFQRQRAASESMDQEDRDPHQTDIIQYIAHTDDVAFHAAGSPFLPSPASPPPSLGRLEPGEGGAGSPGEAAGPEQPSAYHDIWSLRASLELYASSERSNDQDSVRSDGGDSVSSAGGVGPCPSCSLDEAEGPEEKLWGRPKADESEPGTRKLLQMDSGYASIEAPSRGGEEGPPKDQTASEKRICFTSAGRKGTIFESFEGHEPEEEEEEEEEEEQEEEEEGSRLRGAAGGGLPHPHSPLSWSPYGQMLAGREAPPRRDYSIDEKTDALFNAFVRHDPQFDESPLRGKHRSRTHLRKQWQHAKQYSDPGVRYPALERHRTPLRRGDSANYPLDARFHHSPLPRIVSAGDEEAAAAAEEAADGIPPAAALPEPEIQVIVEEPAEVAPEPKGGSEPHGDGDCDGSGRCLGLGSGSELMDKIAGGLEERLYGHLRRAAARPEPTVAVAASDAPPDHSPV
ncbi:voltage-dependent calcium channel beta subunit-associated regulatory protein [Colius striatus]|uniref:voltage-dependent calcium channel beta subunit-associated regulatory protein n=1 Tax=Colius striatus TaxID=57412 RepID=UPI002B1DD073|nr:voltage-dependent calcium channel beta subunit-associated regulatory protein [Colius striatus]XP_061871076.1 voltage-dependent calcium channel beta subunit-associated regulatory protein [Colius striatus]